MTTFQKRKVVLERRGISYNGGVRHRVSGRQKQEEWGEPGPWVTHSFSSPRKNGGKNHSGKPLLRSLCFCLQLSTSLPTFFTSLPPSFPVLRVPKEVAAWVWCTRVTSRGQKSLCVLLQASLLSKLPTKLLQGKREGKECEGCSSVSAIACTDTVHLASVLFTLFFSTGASPHD